MIDRAQAPSGCLGGQCLTAESRAAMVIAMGYPNGQTIDMDPSGWAKRIVKRVSPAVREYLNRPMPVDKNKPMAGLKPGQASWKCGL